MKIAKLLGKTMKAVNRNKPTILTWMTVFGVVSTAVLSFDAGIKAERILRELPEDATLKEKGLAVSHILIKPAATAGATVACALGANKEAMKQISSLTTAWELSKISDQNFKDVVKDKVGEEKFKEIEEELEMPPSDVLTGDESYLPDMKPEDYEVPVKIRDEWSGQKYWAKPCIFTQVRTGMRDRIESEGYASFNDYVDLVQEAAPNSMEWTSDGEEKGWYKSDNFSPKDFDFRFECKLDSNRRPTLVVWFTKEPSALPDHI